MKKITLLIVVFAFLVSSTNLVAQTYFSAEINNSGTAYASNPGSFAGYPWGTGIPNYAWDNTNATGITIHITNYDETNPSVGNQLFINWSRVGFGNAPLNWGSDNASTLATLTPTDFTNGEATVTVDIPVGTLPVEQTADYVTGYKYILQVVGANPPADQTYINFVSSVSEQILSTKTFEKFSSFYPNPVNDKIYFRNDVQTDSYKVLSVTGALIREVDGTSRSIDISDLKAGLYFIATDDSVGKFVKQ